MLNYINHLGLKEKWNLNPGCLSNMRKYWEEDSNLCCFWVKNWKKARKEFLKAFGRALQPSEIKFSYI